MRRARAMLQLLAALCVACASATPDSAGTPEPAQQAPVMPLPLGLTCDQCMAFDALRCGDAMNRPIIAVVSGLRRVDSRTECHMASPEYPLRCAAQEVVRFERLRFLRNRRGASAQATFAAFHDYYDYGTGPPTRLPAEHARGVLLERNHTYLIFVGDYRPNGDLPAEWHVSAACAIPDKTNIGELP
jgi:hypothetical protein